MEAFIVILLLSCFATATYAHNVHLSSLNQSFIVSASATTGQVVNAGDNITITWAYNLTSGAVDTNYTTVEAKLCYAPVSQTGRDDRKTDDNLDNDKTCPFDITSEPYKRSNNTFIWTVPRDIPTATYFVRVYAINAKNHELAYGQTTDTLKTTNLFQINGTISDQQVSSALPVSFFGYRYAWLLMLFFF